MFNILFFVHANVPRIDIPRAVFYYQRLYSIPAHNIYRSYRILRYPYKIHMAMCPRAPRGTYRADLIISFPPVL